MTAVSRAPDSFYQAEFVVQLRNYSYQVQLYWYYSLASSGTGTSTPLRVLS